MIVRLINGTWADDAIVNERKRGEWISNAIVSYAQSMQYDDKGALERMEAKIDKLLALLSKQGLASGRWTMGM